MKSLTGILLCVLICTATYNAQTSQTIVLKSGKFTSALTQLNKLPACESVAITGEADDEEWKQLLAALGTKQQLRSVQFLNNSFTEIPSGTEALKQITGISFAGNPLMNLAGAVESLKKLGNLSSLGFDIISIDELPKNMNQLVHVSEFHFRSADLFSNAAQKKEAGVTLEFLQPLLFADGAKRQIKIFYTGSNADEMRADMSWIGSVFPGTYEGSDNLSSSNFSFNDFSLYKNHFEKTYAHVKPPLKDAVLKNEMHLISGTGGGMLETKSGTVISIPQNAFVDAAGAPVKGEVVIAYREFKDPVDFFLSGIPMTYDSGGIKNVFESAGMFEINASSNGKEVFLSPGKKIDMEFTTTDTAGTFNFYSFNDSTGNWDNIGKPGKAKALPKRYELTKAYLFYERYKHRSWYYDTLDFQERFLNLKYAGTHKLEGKNYTVRVKRNKYLRIWQTVKVSSASVNRAGELTFRIRCQQHMNAEMHIFAGVKWKLADNSQAVHFKKHVASKAYLDLRVNRVDGEYEITVKSTAGFETFTAIPLVKNSDNKWIEMKDGGKSMFKKYSHMLKFREKKFAREQRNDRSYIYGMRINDMEVFNNWLYKETRKCMNDSEKTIPRSEWDRYIEKLYEWELSSRSAQDAARMKVTRSLSLSGMGIFNCDQISRMEDPVTVNAQYLRGDSTFRPASIYVMSEGTNAIFNYNAGKYGGYSASYFALEKKKKSMILIIEEDGNVCIVRASAVGASGYLDSRLARFKADRLKVKGLSAEEVKKQLAFN